MTEDNTAELQQKYMQLQLFQQQIEQVQKQMQMLDKQFQELHIVKQGLDDLKNTKNGTEILVPISSGIFVTADLKDNKKVTVNVGSDVAAEKTVDQAQELIVKQIDEVAKIKEQLTADLSKMRLQAGVLQQELQKMVENV
ncbi:prefoldin subunit alpha [Candidatus Woesearchaeota archaeon]|nr:prefoldin subunit alpha [Candidatus Woesearchaeota archaeon]